MNDELNNSESLPASEATSPSEPAGEPTQPPGTPIPAPPAAAPIPVAAPQTAPAAPPVAAAVAPTEPQPASPMTEPAKRGVGVGTVIAVAFIMALLFGGLAGGAAGLAGAWYSTHESVSSGGSSTVTVVPSETDEPVVAAAAAALPSVVNIDVTGGTVTSDSGTLPDDHPSVPLQGNGSGVAWTSAEDGGTYIITNNHVVADADTIVVTDSNRDHFDATVVGTDPETDIAVVRVDADIPTIQIADSDALQVGQAAVAIGSPYGLSQSVSSGVISALGRSLPDSLATDQGVYPLVDVIQTDAAINPGNSGGALLDRTGALIGVNAAIYSESGSSDGVGFAIPSNTAVRIAQELVDNGQADHPFLGVLGRDVDATLAQEENLPVQEGAYIVDITPGTNAEKADLQAGDVIVKLDDTDIQSMDDLILAVRRHAIGDVVTITLYRDGEQMQVEMEVGTKPANLDTQGSQGTE